MLTLMWADAVLVFGSQHTVTSMWNIHQWPDSTTCGAQLDQGQNCNTVCSSVQWQSHWSHDQPSNFQEEYASECHIIEKKILHSTQEMKNSTIIYHVGHVTTCVFQEHPLHNNTEKHMACSESILDIKYVLSFFTNIDQMHLKCISFSVWCL